MVTQEIIDEYLEDIPTSKQTQMSLVDQEIILIAVANRLGLYDAEDSLRNRLVREGHLTLVGRVCRLG